MKINIDTDLLFALERSSKDRYKGCSIGEDIARQVEDCVYEYAKNLFKEGKLQSTSLVCFKRYQRERRESEMHDLSSKKRTKLDVLNDLKDAVEAVICDLQECEVVPFTLPDKDLRNKLDDLIREYSNWDIYEYLESKRGKNENQ